MKTKKLKSKPATTDNPKASAELRSKDGLGGGFLPWNHPLRIEAEELVKRWNFYAQTHLPSDSNRELASMIVNFVQAHQPPNDKLSHGAGNQP